MTLISPILTRAQRAEGIAFARRWRILSKPFFDAMYGPETRAEPCQHCEGTGMVHKPVTGA